MDVLILIIVLLCMISVLSVFIFNRLCYCTCLFKHNWKDGIFINMKAKPRVDYKKMSCLCWSCVCSERSDNSVIFLPDSQQINYGSSSTDNTQTEKTSLQNQKKPINNQCPICFEMYNQDEVIVLLTCRHGYHEVCLSKWVEAKSRHTTCPLCVREINLDVLNFDESFYYDSLPYHQSVSSLHRFEFPTTIV